MDDGFMASSTPSFLTDSLEMAMEVENENSKTPCFSCAFDSQSGGRSFSAESYLASGSLKRYVFSSVTVTVLRCSPHGPLVPLNPGSFLIHFSFIHHDPEVCLVAHQSGKGYCVYAHALAPVPSFVSSRMLQEDCSVRTFHNWGNAAISSFDAFVLQHLCSLQRSDHLYRCLVCIREL